MVMDWSLWRPREDTLASIKELLQDALIPDSEIQKDVQTKLKHFELADDFTYYLLYIVGQTQFSEEIRSLSGILLKNTIVSIYTKLPLESVIKIRQLCLMLLLDQCKDVRCSISNVIYTLAKGRLSTWPELIPFLVKSFETDCSDVTLTTLFSICEDLMVMSSKNKDEIFCVTKEVFPKFVDFLLDDSCVVKKHNIIRLINQFLQDHIAIMRQSIDIARYLQNVIHLAVTDDLDLQKHVCHTFVIYIGLRDECVIPHLHDIIVYSMLRTQHYDMEIALGACEFWLALTKLSNCKEIILPYIKDLLPILLTNMKYSNYELIALKDNLKIDDNTGNQLGSEQFPFNMHSRRFVHEDNSYYNEDDDEDEDGNDGDEAYLNSCDDVDDFYVGWTLRKCSAASLDAIAVKLGDEILPVITPLLNEMLQNPDYLIKESSILALGAISEGAINGMEQYLPLVIDYLMAQLNDEHSIVRVITCWTLSRYIGWIVNTPQPCDKYFMPLMIILLKHFVDENKRVQRAAISAFCVFQEEAQVKLIPYIDLILEGFQFGFQKFHVRSLYLLYDAINVLAMSVGKELNKKEYIEKLMPPLIHKLKDYASFSDDHFVAVLECLANLIPSLDIGCLAYAEHVYCVCLDVLSDTYIVDNGVEENEASSTTGTSTVATATLSTMQVGGDMVDLVDFIPSNKESLHVALDVLYSLTCALKSYMCKYVSNSTLVAILYQTMQDCSYAIRQSSIALFGELVSVCYPYIVATVNMGDYIRVLLKNLIMLNQKYEGVVKNAAFVIGRLVTVMGMDILPYAEEILQSFINILRLINISRAVLHTVAVSMCIMCCIQSQVVINDQQAVENVIKNCCMSLRTLKDSDIKDLAFRGLCNIIVSNPQFCHHNFIYFCDAVASWNELLNNDLREIIRSLLIGFKERVDEVTWIRFYDQFPDLLKTQLFNLYGVW